MKESFYKYFSNEDLIGARELLLQGHDPNELDESGQTPIFRVVYNKVKSQKDFLFLLIEFKADINSKRNDGATPIFFANREIAEVLIQNGADLTIKDNSGNTPLHTAIDFDVADLFIKNGLYINNDNNSNETPLHYFVWIGNEMVDLAIKNGANVNAKDKFYRTPFINLAMTYGFNNNEDVADILKSAELLYNAGSDLKITDIEGYDAIYYANQYENNNLAKWITKKLSL